MQFFVSFPFLINVFLLVLLVFSASSSRCRGLVCNVRLRHFPAILTFWYVSVDEKIKAKKASLHKCADPQEHLAFA